MVGTAMNSSGWKQLDTSFSHRSLGVWVKETDPDTRKELPGPGGMNSVQTEKPAWH